MATGCGRAGRACCRRAAVSLQAAGCGQVLSEIAHAMPVAYSCAPDVACELALSVERE